LSPGTTTETFAIDATTGTITQAAITDAFVSADSSGNLGASSELTIYPGVAVESQLPFGTAFNQSLYNLGAEINLKSSLLSIPAGLMGFAIQDNDYFVQVVNDPVGPGDFDLDCGLMTAGQHAIIYNFDPIYNCLLSVSAGTFVGNTIVPPQSTTHIYCHPGSSLGNPTVLRIS